MIKVAVIGAGYWGPNLIRNFVVCPDTRLVAVCDRDHQRLQAALASYPGVDAVASVGHLLARDDVDAVAIATPVATHAPITLAALEAGKHVLVEKPLADSVAAAQQMVWLAASKGLTLMVDHTFVYHPAVQTMKRLIDSGELGEIYYIDSVRINLGLFQHDVNVLWDLAPHDLSIVDYLLQRSPQSVSAVGACHADVHDAIEDVAYLSLDFGKGLLASIHVNWLSPVKIRHFMIGGSKKSVVYNDLEPNEKVKVYDRGISITPDPEERRGVLIGYRTGDVWSPHFKQTEPLQNLICHFAQCIREQAEPLTSGEAGLRVVRVLEAAQRSIKARDRRVTLARAA